MFEYRTAHATLQCDHQEEQEQKILEIAAKLAKEGWELISIVPFSMFKDSNFQHLTGFFKRRKKPVTNKKEGKRGAGKIIGRHI